MSQARRPARRRLGLAMTPFALLAALDGCAGRPSARNSPLTDSARLAIYERAGAGYTNVLFFKPLDAGPADAMGFAPLILQETDADERRPMGVSSAELSASNTIPSLPGPAPTIYFQGSQTLIHGRRHNQVIYLWRHPDWTPRDNRRFGKSPATRRARKLFLCPTPSNGPRAWSTADRCPDDDFRSNARRAKRRERSWAGSLTTRRCRPVR